MTPLELFQYIVAFSLGIAIATVVVGLTAMAVKKAAEYLDLDC